MADTEHRQIALGDNAARQLANATKTTAQLATITPPLAGPPAAMGPRRGGHLSAEQSQEPARCEGRLRQTRRIRAAADLRRLRGAAARVLSQRVATVLDVHTRVSDLYSSPHDQIKEQLRLTIETIKEKPGKRADQQPRLRSAQQRRASRSASSRSPARRRPDDLDELITRCGRSRRSSSRTRWPLPPSAASAPAAACRRRP